MIQLHYWPTANCLKIGILLEELKLEYELLPVNIRRAEHKTDDFLKVGAGGRIPVMVDTGGNLSLFESGAILNYLGTAFVPEANSPAYHKVQQWLFWQVGHISPCLGQLQFLREKAPAANLFVQGLFQTEAFRLYEVLERALLHHEYVAETYSIADMAIFPWIQPTRQGIDLADFPAIEAWRNRIKARPAVQEAYKRGRSIAAEEKSLVVE